MKLVNQYIIPFKGLKEGEHNYDFEIGEAFFEEYPSLEIPSGNIDADIILLKKSNFLELDVVLSGVLELQCDRCLENFTFPLEFSGQLFVKFKEEANEPDDNVIYLHPNDDTLDLTQYFIDSIGLSIPIQRFHPDFDDGEPGCNPKMLEKLQEHSFEDQSDNEATDPRWDKFKDLLDEKNKN